MKLRQLKILIRRLDASLTKAPLSRPEQIELNDLLRDLISKHKKVLPKEPRLVPCEHPGCTERVMPTKIIKRCRTHYPHLCNDCKQVFYTFDLPRHSYVSLYSWTKVQRGPYRKYACGLCPSCTEKKKEAGPELD